MISRNYFFTSFFILFVNINGMQVDESDLISSRKKIIY
jgi:hypothetical protein